MLEFNNMIPWDGVIPQQAGHVTNKRGFISDKANTGQNVIV